MEVERADREEQAAANVRKKAAALEKLTDRFDQFGYFSITGSEIEMPVSVPVGMNRLLLSSPPLPRPRPIFLSLRCAPQPRRVRSQLI